LDGFLKRLKNKKSVEKYLKVMHGYCNHFYIVWHKIYKTFIHMALYYAKIPIIPSSYGPIKSFLIILKK